MRSLKHSEEYFWMASNDHTLQNDAAVVEFNSSWVAKHKICYLQGIAVRINFPRLPEMHTIEAFPQVQATWWKKYAKENNIAVLNNSVSCTFQVNQVQQLGLNEANLSLDVLYRLRYHPVIDAVGVFSQGDNGADLVYFQVSLSSYDGHLTKINDLFASNYKTKGYSELTASILPFTNITRENHQERSKMCVAFIYQQQQPTAMLVN